MASHTPAHDDETLYPVTSNVPVEIINPKRKARLIAGAWIAAVVMCTIAGSYVAAVIAISQNDVAKQQLRAEIDRRTRQHDAENAQLKKAMDQYRQDQCKVTAKLPQTPDIAEIRARYRCTNPVTPSATAGPSSSPVLLTALPRWPVRPPAGPGRPAAPEPGPPPPTQPPATTPTPPPVVPPLPSPSKQCIELPVLGVCLLN